MSSTQHAPYVTSPSIKHYTKQILDKISAISVEKSKSPSGNCRDTLKFSLLSYFLQSKIRQMVLGISNE